MLSKCRRRSGRAGRRPPKAPLSAPSSAPPGIASPPLDPMPSRHNLLHSLDANLLIRLNSLWLLKATRSETPALQRFDGRASVGALLSCGRHPLYVPGAPSLHSATRSRSSQPGPSLKGNSEGLDRCGCRSQTVNTAARRAGPPSAGGLQRAEAQLLRTSSSLPPSNPSFPSPHPLLVRLFPPLASALIFW
jgi:hypothetical protein